MTMTMDEVKVARPGVRAGDARPDCGAYVHFGCQFRAPAGWLNFDASPTLIFEKMPLLGRLYTRNGQRFPRNVRYGDIVKGLAVQPASCAGVFGSHVLEHLALSDCDRALANIHGYLRPGGIFRLVVPDLEGLARAYLEDTHADAANNFMLGSYLGRKTRPRGLAGISTAILGNAAHLWMWDWKSMEARLRSHGFHAIRRASFNDCEDPRFLEVEEKHRFEGALAIECRR